MADQPSHLVVSFCNTTSSAPALSLFEIASGDMQVLRVPAELTRRGGASGVAVTPHFVVVLGSRAPAVRAAREPSSPATLFIFDRRTLALQARAACRSVFDAHSLIVDGDDLLVVSTGTDAVVRVRLDGVSVVSEEIVWRPDPNGPVADVHHLNGICRWRDHVLVSGFGKRSALKWSSATDGFICDITTGEHVASGLRHPHSVVPLDDALWCCESGLATVGMVGTDRRQRLGGYPRGLCGVGDAVFVATSRARVASQADDRLTSRGDPGTLTGASALHQLRLSDLQVQSTTTLDPYGWEVYDLVPVSDVASWPVVGALEWRDAAIAGLRIGDDEHDVTRSWLHLEVAQRDRQIAGLHEQGRDQGRALGRVRAEHVAVIAELQDTVGDRSRTIEKLHLEVAGRDAAIDTLHHAVAVRDATLASLHREVADRDRTLESLGTELVDRDHLLAWLHREVSDRDHTIEAGHREIVTRVEMIDALHLEIAALHREVASRDQTIEWLHREVAHRDQLVAGPSAVVAATTIDSGHAQSGEV